MDARRLLACAVLVAAQGAAAVAWANIIRTSEVSADVTQNPDLSYTYNYTVRNTSPGGQEQGEFIDIWPTIIDFEVPLDDPSIVWDVLSPETWYYEFLTPIEYETRYGEPDPFGAPCILHWFTGVLDGMGKRIVPEGFAVHFNYPPGNVYEPETDGFIFTSFLPPESGPYLTSWLDEARNPGDPPLPGGTVGGDGTLHFTPTGSQIPEPLTLTCLAMGLGLLRTKLRRRAR